MTRNVVLYDTIRSARRYIATVASPQLCLACGRPSRSDIPLCRECREAFFSIDSGILGGSRCLKCGRPLISASGLCVDCRTLGMLKFVDRILPLFPYDAVAQDALVAWKLRGKRCLSRDFADLLAAFLATWPESRGTVIVPVPPRPKKMREKGWDQIRELAGLLSACHSLTIDDCLWRTSSVQQKKLGRSARFANIGGTMVVKPRAAVADRAIVLDDLMTTGSTIDACAEALKGAGCSVVYGLTLFYD